MKEKFKNTKGITLIALIITIIILIILAMVSIKLVKDSGIITNSETATNNYVVEEEKEKIKLGLAERKMAAVSDPNAGLTVNGARVRVRGDATAGWTVTFTKTGHVYTVDADGKIIEGGNSTPTNPEERYNISFKNITTMTRDSLPFANTPEVLVLENTSTEKMVIIYSFPEGTDTVPEIGLYHLNTTNKMLDNPQTDTYYRCYNDNGWVMEKHENGASTPISEFPEMENVTIINNGTYTIYIEDEENPGETIPMECNKMTEEHQQIFVTLTEVQ